MFDTDKLPLALGPRRPRADELAKLESEARRKWEPVKVNDRISSRDGLWFTTLEKPKVPRKPADPSRADQKAAEAVKTSKKSFLSSAGWRDDEPPRDTKLDFFNQVDGRTGNRKTFNYPAKPWRTWKDLGWMWRKSCPESGDPPVDTVVIATRGSTSYEYRALESGLGQYRSPKGEWMSTSGWERWQSLGWTWTWGPAP